MNGEPRCEAPVWKGGMDRLCGDTLELATWIDYRGVGHNGCPRHAGGLKRRYPSVLPERTAPSGTLGLGTPWTRGRFAPADVIDVENAIPAGYRINVIGRSRNTFVLIGIQLDPTGGYDNVELFRTPPTGDPYRVALAMADRLRLHAQEFAHAG